MSVADDLDLFGQLDTSSLPPRQQRILVAIRDWVLRYGYAPSTREIGEVVGLRSPSSVSQHLASLEEQASCAAARPWPGRSTSARSCAARRPTPPRTPRSPSPSSAT